MKTILLPLAFCLACGFLPAQTDTLVSKIPQNRHVLLEEFTGVQCSNCPAGHQVSNSLAQEYGERLHIVNIHASTLANPPSASEPDFRTAYGDVFLSHTETQSIPVAMINRHSFTEELAYDRTKWEQYVKAVSQMPAYANIAAKAVTDYSGRKLSVEVQVYATGNENPGTHYLHVLIVQNNIPGYQKNASANPGQYLPDGRYNHMHALREMLTGTWGDSITLGPAGNFISRTYTKDLPEKIRNIDLDLQEIQIIAFLTQGKDEVINACEASLFYENGPEYVFKPLNGKQQDQNTCNSDIRVSFSLENRNAADPEIHSVEFLCKSSQAQNTFTHEFDSTFGFGRTAEITSEPFPIDAINRNDTVEISISKVNGKAYAFSDQKTLKIPVIKRFNYTASDTVVFNLWQDGFGTETRWTFTGPKGETLAQDGPYSDIPISQEKCHTYDIRLSEGCHVLKITDSRGDGINNGFGNGHFNITTPEGEILVEHDGIFSDSVSVMIGKTGAGNDNLPIAETIRAELFPNPASESCNLRILSEKSHPLDISVFNLSGTRIWQKQYSAFQGENIFNLPVRNFPSGTYILRIEGPNTWKSLKIQILR